eukprot:TRINITY_DN39402_c0_g1_i1.p1 TRINITY_DN39402_c0_g1~~TRINITY_DN39402_c0_g1_i1.p1  ORF type:complete len:631 (-),score=175.55 TRINITY_DN39402_c0_g1_i1:45-1937(-)
MSLFVEPSSIHFDFCKVGFLYRCPLLLRVPLDVPRDLILHLCVNGTTTTPINVFHLGNIKHRALYEFSVDVFYDASTIGDAAATLSITVGRSPPTGLSVHIPIKGASYPPREFERMKTLRRMTDLSIVSTASGASAFFLSSKTILPSLATECSVPVDGSVGRVATAKSSRSSRTTRKTAHVASIVAGGEVEEEKDGVGADMDLEFDDVPETLEFSQSLSMHGTLKEDEGVVIRDVDVDEIHFDVEIGGEEESGFVPISSGKSSMKRDGNPFWISRSRLEGWVRSEAIHARHVRPILEIDKKKKKEATKSTKAMVGMNVMETVDDDSIDVRQEIHRETQRLVLGSLMESLENLSRRSRRSFATPNLGTLKSLHPHPHPHPHPHHYASSPIPPPSPHASSPVVHYYMECYEHERFAQLLNFVRSKEKRSHSKIVIVFSCVESVRFHAYIADVIKGERATVYAMDETMRMPSRSPKYYKFVESKEPSFLLTTWAALEDFDVPIVDWIVHYEPIRCISQVHAGGKVLMFLHPHEVEGMKNRIPGLTRVDASEWSTVKGEEEHTEEHTEELPLGTLPMLLKNKSGLSEAARRAFQGYLISYAKNMEKDVYDVHRLDIGGIAHAFGFTEVPSVDIP